MCQMAVRWANGVEHLHPQHVSRQRAAHHQPGATTNHSSQRPDEVQTSSGLDPRRGSEPEHRPSAGSGATSDVHGGRDVVEEAGPEGEPLAAPEDRFSWNVLVAQQRHRTGAPAVLLVEEAASVSGHSPLATTIGTYWTRKPTFIRLTPVCTSSSGRSGRTRRLRRARRGGRCAQVPTQMAAPDAIPRGLDPAIEEFLGGPGAALQPAHALGGVEELRRLHDADVRVVEVRRQLVHEVRARARSRRRRSTMRSPGCARSRSAGCRPSSGGRGRVGPVARTRTPQPARATSGRSASSSTQTSVDRATVEPADVVVGVAQEVQRLTGTRQHHRPPTGTVFGAHRLTVFEVVAQVEATPRVRC